MPDRDALNAFLAQQAGEYRASLPARRVQLLAAWAELQARPADGAAWLAVERCAHGIAGSAATFGLPALGACARRLEQACEDAAEARAPAAQALRPLVDALAEALRSTGEAG